MFSQTDTKTQSPNKQIDTVKAIEPKPEAYVALPVKYVKHMVNDIVKGDSCVVTVVSLVNGIQDCEKENSSLRKENYNQKNTIGELTMSDNANKSINRSLNEQVKKYKKQKNIFKIIAGGLLVGFLIKN